MMDKVLANETAVWVLLVCITVFSWLLAENDLAGKVMYLVIVLSAAKVYLIALSYMETLRANRVFCYFFFAWSALIVLLIIIFKLFLF